MMNKKNILLLGVLSVLLSVKGQNTDNLKNFRYAFGKDSITIISQVDIRDYISNELSRYLTDTIKPCYVVVNLKVKSICDSYYAYPIFIFNHCSALKEESIQNVFRRVNDFDFILIKSEFDKLDIDTKQNYIQFTVPVLKN